MQETAEQYIKRILGYVEGQDAMKVQRTTAPRLKKAITGLTPKQLKWRPQPAKWSISEIIAHLADAEIVASWRMAHFPGTRTSFACAISMQRANVSGSPRPATFRTVSRCVSGSRCRMCRISRAISST